jgi:protein-S-isoprenylcysteine O-methyltransferase Ste14
MPSEELFLNRVVVFVGAFLYWGGVLIQARRVRRRIGRSPNTRPRRMKEKLLWAGWSVVIIAWMALPFVAGTHQHLPWLGFFPSLLHPAALALGILLTVLGYAGTLWCYAAMGDAWRMGTNINEQTALVTGGPYRWVRHPIYLFQMAMLAGVILVLPTPLSLLNFFIHAGCVLVKVADEESYLGAVHGKKYGEYGERTGRFFPRFYRKRAKAKW